MLVGIIVLLTMCIFSVYGISKANYLTINILTLFVFFQNFMLIVISRYIDATFYNVIVLTKEVYVVFVILYAIYRRPRTDKLNIFCISAIILLFLLTFFYSTGAFGGRLASLRQLYLPFLFFSLGTSINTSKGDIQNIIQFYVFISFVSVLFGFFELLVGDIFWGKLGIQKYAEFKNFDRFIFKNKIVPGAFYSFDFTPLLPGIRRMVSFLADAVIFGQLLSVAFILTLFYKGITRSFKMRAILSIVIGIGLMMTIAKGGIIIAGICFLTLINKLWKKKGLSILGWLFAIAIGFIYFIFSMKNRLSSAAHFNGLLDGINLLRQHPLGLGIGGFGNLGKLYGLLDVEGSGESFIGAAIGQLGVLAIVLYLYFYTKLFKRLKRIKTPLSEIIIQLNIGLLLTSFFNNTAMSFTGCYIFFVLAALCIRENTCFQIYEKVQAVKLINNRIFKCS